MAKRFDDGGCVSLTASSSRWPRSVPAGDYRALDRGFRDRDRPAAPRFWLVAVLVGAGGFGLSFLLFNMVIVQVDAGRAAVVLNLIPVFGVASAVIFLGEGMTGRDALGAFLIGSSVLYFAIADHREATAQARRAEQDALRLLPVAAGAAHRVPKHQPARPGRADRRGFAAGDERAAGSCTAASETMSRPNTAAVSQTARTGPSAPSSARRGRGIRGVSARPEAR